ncbi:MAG: hypothetical protein AAGI03_11905 [Pseudomonadota bacterium]
MLDPFIEAEGQYVCGLISAFLSIAAFAPYIRDTLFHGTRPLRASWLIWSVLSAISFTSQVSEGATMSLFYAGAQSGGTILIFLLAVRRGKGTYLRGRDGIVIAAACAGLIAWYATDSAAYALFISCGISLLAGSVTVAKAFAQPDSETMSCWVVSLLAAGFALMSVGRLDPILMAYPAYLIILNTAIVAAMVLGRAAQAPRMTVSPY